MNLQENIRRILREETYSPGGKKYRPGRFVYHKSDIKNRTDILKYGLIPSVGECYKEYSKGGCVPAIFVTDSTNPEQWFETERDDDIWRIDTEISNVDWRVDKHFKDMRHPEFGRYRHIVTFQEVIPESLKLVHKGTGKYIYESVMKGGVDLPSKFLRRFRVFRDAVLNTDAVLNPCEYDSFNHFKSSIYQNVSEMVDEGYINNKPVSEWLSYELGILYIEQYMMDDLKEYYYVECVE